MNRSNKTNRNDSRWSRAWEVTGDDHIYIHIYMYVYTYMYIYIYIHKYSCMDEPRQKWLAMVTVIYIPHTNAVRVWMNNVTYEPRHLSLEQMSREQKWVMSHMIRSNKSNRNGSRGSCAVRAWMSHITYGWATSLSTRANESRAELSHVRRTSSSFASAMVTHCLCMGESCHIGLEQTFATGKFTQQVLLYIHVSPIVKWHYAQKVTTEWRRPIACLKLQVSFCKRATSYMALLWKMTCTKKASYGSLPPCDWTRANVRHRKFHTAGAALYTCESCSKVTICTKGNYHDWSKCSPACHIWFCVEQKWVMSEGLLARLPAR